MPTPLVQPALVFNFAVILWDVQGPAFFGAGAGDPGAQIAANIVGGFVANLSQALFGGFSDVQGLNVELDIETYNEGGNNYAPLKFAKAGKYPSLVCKRGVTTRTDLWDWHQQALSGRRPLIRKSGLIILFDRGGPGAGNPALGGLTRVPLAAWYVDKALPERIDGPQLDAKGNAIAMESVSFAHQGITRVSLSMIPGLGDVGAALGGLVGGAAAGAVAGTAGLSVIP